MAEDELMALSTRELALYRDLAQAYEALLGVLEAPAASAAAPALAEATARTERVTQALRAVSAALGPARLAGRPVPETVRAIWRASAAKAAEALRLNEAVIAGARARQGALAARLGVLDRGRRALAGYARAAAPSAA
jgi:hypothetical protein